MVRRQGSNLQPLAPEAKTLIQLGYGPRWERVGNTSWEFRVGAVSERRRKGNAHARTARRFATGLALWPSGAAGTRWRSGM